MIALALLLAVSSVEAPEREALFDLDGPKAAAVGAALAGGGSSLLAVAGVGLLALSPTFAILPIVATIGLPVAVAVGAVTAAALDESAVGVGVATGAGVVAVAMVGAVMGFGGASLANYDDGTVLALAWCGGMIGGTIGGAGTAALMTTLAR